MQTSTKKIQKILGALSALAMLFATSALVSCSSDSSESSDMTVKISSATGTSLKADGTTTLTAKVTDGGSSLSYVWSITGVDGTVASSSEYFKFDSTSGAAVDAKGTNTTTSSHKVTIKCVVTDNSSKKTTADSLTITVKAADSALSSVSISGSTAIEAAENAILTATPTYTGSPEITYSWEITSGSDYASLSATSGSSVTIEGKNTTSSSQTIKVKVTASCNGTTQTDTKTITVAAVGATVEDEITSASISPSSSSSIATKGTLTLTASYESTGKVSDVSYSWKITEGGGYASLSSTSGKEVTLTGNNQTSSSQTVKVKVTVSGKKKSDLTTTSKDSEEVSITVGAASVTSVILSKTTLSLAEGKDSTLTATVEGTNLPIFGKTVTWESSDTVVATVSDGKVTAVKAGTATIKATSTFDTSKSASCTVTVTEANSSTTNSISASDTPVGYAEIDTSKFATTVTVSKKSDLVDYAKKGGYLIYVDGMIDMSDGMLPSTAGGSTTELDSFVATKTSDSYKSYTDFRDAYAKSCSDTTEDGESSSTTKSSLYDTLWNLNEAYGNVIKLNVASNTAIIGLTSSSGIKGGTIQISGKSNVVLRNLTIQDAYDPFPHHEKNDGFNAQWDGITIQGSCSNIWIDHCTLEDTMKYVEVTTKSRKEKWQTYDGLCDIKGDGKGITVSFCKFYNHDKTMLIGSSDTEGNNSVRKVTLHHNYFLNCGQRLPMVRNTTIHIFNNYYDFGSSAFYSSSYAVGVRKNAVIYAENNYFGSGIQNSFKNSDGKLYSRGNTDMSKKGCESTVTGNSLFSSAVNAYDYSSVLESAADAKSTVESNAGAGVWTVKQ